MNVENQLPVQIQSILAALMVKAYNFISTCPTSARIRSRCVPESTRSSPLFPHSLWRLPRTRSGNHVNIDLSLSILDFSPVFFSLDQRDHLRVSTSVSSFGSRDRQKKRKDSFHFLFYDSVDLYALAFVFGICIDCSCDRRIFIRSVVSDLFVGVNASGNGNLSCEEEEKNDVL
ncbi:hypothetical protein MRB53_001453 [Persea americana]|uniref:Uncharacterized protein n=1 Tax=Persea americana TaxID=3435 RepID=A0ACC2MRS7_PERAE|nr:hypothetical protein MRB53_001453 [Persea americana]